jgi:PEP-CTERM motif-containing protein
MLRNSVYALAVAVAVGAPAHAATQITVENIGSVLNESLALPAEDTPGSGIGFMQFFEFTLPVAETVTVSVSDSAIGAEQITGGVLSLNTFTSSAPVSPFQPIGALIESSSILDVLGGQEATVSPDVLGAGAFFAEVSGISGDAPIHIAIDGTITALATPEPSTWAMALIGFGFLAAFGFRKRQVRSFGV